ncbi:acyl-CoA synthetase [Rhodococcus kronopolitis]|uniref:Acyl-CoA synthetase n=1 Tax=Rhodococcus kronopolitis TaxID=1460226 RepID=A0ABV9FSI1_9NOCA
MSSSSSTRNLADIFEAVADAMPDREVLVCGDQRRTLAELDERANRVGHHLLAAGVQAGDHVGMHMRNSVEFVETLLGLLKIRAVPVNVNYRYIDAELRYLYANADLAAVVVDADFVDRTTAVAPDCPVLRHVLVLGEPSAESAAALAAVVPSVSDYRRDVDSASGARDFPARSDDDLFVIYTGGTTGMPKGVLWRQEDFFRSALVSGNQYGDGYDDGPTLAAAHAQNPTPPTFLLTAPLIHGAAVYTLFTGLFMGTKTVLMPQFDALESLALVEREKVNIYMIVGDAIGRPFADAVAAHGGDYDLSSLFVVGSGGALWSQVVRDQITALFPNIYLNNGFGSSESGMDGSMQALEDGSLRMAPRPGVCVVDADLRPIAPGSDDIGWVAHSGHVPLGYYNDPAKTASTFPVVDGVRMSVLGDMARVEPDGSIIILGRGSACINSGGEKIYVEEVEEALKSHPAVFDALVAGLPDPRFGQRVAAVVQLREGAAATVEELTEHCRGRIARYKVPREIVEVPAILRSPSGKADYRWAQTTLEKDATSS